MALGGARPGSGRKSNIEKALAGIPNVGELLAHGQTPLEIMLLYMRKAFLRAQQAEEALLNSDTVDPQKQKDAFVLETHAFERAAACAPFVHPKLAVTKIDGGGGDDQSMDMISQDERI